MNLQLLRLLADGSFHSGAQLSEQLGVSRTTIWNQIREIQTYGVEINSVRGRGYHITQGLDLLDEEHLKAQLAALDVLPSIDLLDLSLISESTNLSAQRASASGHQRSLFVSEYQSGGRGRRGRSWASPLGANLYFSLSWPFSGGIAALEGLSLAVGVALSRALSALHVEQVQLKWPNDLLLDGRKLGGVLIEIGGDLSGECTAVIGVGLNVAMPASAQAQIDQPWADLQGRLPKNLSRTDLLAVVIKYLVEMLIAFSREGFAALQAEWQRAHAFQQQPVKLIQGDLTIEGLCLGVDKTGALRLRTVDGEQLFQGGELSMRPN